MRDDAEFVRDLYASVLGRRASDEEIKGWVDAMARGLSDRDVFRAFLTSPEFGARVIPGHPIGHYHSPVVNPEAARPFWPKTVDLHAPLPGIDVSVASMLEFWRELEPILRTTDFPAHLDAGRRYFHDNQTFGIGDAAVLRAILGTFRPARVVEIGAGFSTACMLDACDEFHLAATRLLCIEPEADRVRALLRTEDWSRVSLIDAPLQSVDVTTFDALSSGDVLFIDSSHVLKACGDVNAILFEILPRLAPGVLIHFHDIRYPFEYPETWIFDNRWSWNEAYALRAFLMYNARYEILLMNDLLAHARPDAIAGACPAILQNPGGSLWLRKIA